MKYNTFGPGTVVYENTHWAVIERKLRAPLIVCKKCHYYMSFMTTCFHCANMIPKKLLTLRELLK